LSDSKTFQVFVSPPPQFGSAVSDGTGNIHFTFNSLSGQSYQLEYKNNLSDATWTPLGPPEPGTGGSVTMDDNLTAQPQRFYRLVVLP
jgi:hypothetical protein